MLVEQIRAKKPYTYLDELSKCYEGQYCTTACSLPSGNAQGGAHVHQCFCGLPAVDLQVCVILYCSPLEHCDDRGSTIAEVAQLLTLCAP